MKHSGSFGICAYIFFVCVFLTCAAIEEEPVIAYSITGRVVDEQGIPLADALVSYTYETIQGETITDENGVYTVQDIDVGIYDIMVSKSGYTTGRTRADVSGDFSLVANVVLNSLVESDNKIETTMTSEEIKEFGFTLEKEFELATILGGDTLETVNQTVSFSIPPETDIFIDGKPFSGSIVFSITLIEEDDVFLTSDELSLVMVLFEPANAEFSKPVSITLPVNLYMPSGRELPLKKYVGDEWREVGLATVNETGLQSDGEITEFGKFSIQLNFSSVTRIIDSEEKEVSTSEIPTNQDTIEIDAGETVEYPQGLPEGTTEHYATSLIEKVESTQFDPDKKFIVDFSEIADQGNTNSPLSGNGTIKNLVCTKTIKNLVVDKTITLTFYLYGEPFARTIVYKIDVIEIVIICVEQVHDQGAIE